MHNAHGIEKINFPSKVDTIEDKMNSLQLKFAESMPEEDIPALQLFFTSEDNAYGPIDLRWVEGNELHFIIQPKDEFYHYSDLTIHRFENIMDTSGCSSQSNFKCTSSR